MRFQVLINTICRGRVASSIAAFETYEAAETAVERITADSGDQGDYVSMWAVRLYKKA